MKIILLNLPRTLNEEELAQLFAPHGELSSHNLVMDSITGKSKGFGFVEMENSAQGLAAIAALNGQKIGSNKIRVKMTD